MGLVAGAGGVLAAVGAVVVGSVAGSVVVVVVALEERVVRRTVGETTPTPIPPLRSPSPMRVCPSFGPLPNDMVMGLPSESQPPIGSLHQFFPMITPSGVGQIK